MHIASFNFADSDIVNPGGTKFESNGKIREATLGLGYVWPTDQGMIKAYAGYTFNTDDDFGETGTLPTSDGADYLTLAGYADINAWGFVHKLGAAYQNFENSVHHAPQWPDFSLGDRYSFKYEIGKHLNKLYLGLGHTWVYSGKTSGTYLYTRPRWRDIMVNAVCPVYDNIFLDVSGKYIYDGSDAPKETQMTLGISFSL